MAQKIYIGITEKARLVKKIYLGQANRARSIIRGYIGVGGKARPFFSLTPSVINYGPISPLSIARTKAGGVTVGNYGLVGGGTTDNTIAGVSAVTDAYNTNLVRSTPTVLSVARYCPIGVPVGNYGLFCGGTMNVSPQYSLDVDAYNNNLVRSTPTKLTGSGWSINIGYYYSATYVADYALISGLGLESSHVVMTYNKSLVRSSTTSELSVQRTRMATFSVGGYGVFCGGRASSSTVSATVDAYNNSLVRSTPTVLSVARCCCCGATVNNSYGLVVGGVTSTSNWSAVTDAYNTSLVRSTPTVLSRASYYNPWGVSIGEYGLFTLNLSSVVELNAYNKNLARSIPLPYDVSREYSIAIQTGQYGIFCGGYGNSATRNNADAYTVA